MKTIGMLLVILFTSVFAQAYPGHSGPGSSIGPMSYATESFRMTCDVVREDYNRIQAYCEDTQGRMIYNDFYRRNCMGDIANINGRLVCTDDASLPQGSYQMTCNSCRVSYPTLSCSCMDTRGNYRYASLNFSRCRGDIANMNGRLVCQ